MEMDEVLPAARTLVVHMALANIGGLNPMAHEAALRFLDDTDEEPDLLYAGVRVLGVAIGSMLEVIARDRSGSDDVAVWLPEAQRMIRAYVDRVDLRVEPRDSDGDTL